MYACTRTQPVRRKKKNRKKMCSRVDYDYELSLTSTFRFFRCPFLIQHNVCTRAHTIEDRLRQLIDTLDPSVDAD